MLCSLLGMFKNIGIKICTDLQEKQEQEMTPIILFETGEQR